MKSPLDDAFPVLIPAASLDSHIAILGKTGSGKSNAAKLIAEKLMAREERVCVLDPTGTWWGMRLDRNGKKPSGLNPVIFGGEHGDLALSDQHGTVIAEAIATSSDSAIIDTRALTVGQRTRFFTTFAETLLRLNRGPLHLIIDEAHIFMPQGRTDVQGGQMLHAGNNLVSLGRGVGLRITLISQRPQKLHKDSLTQVETLVAMRVMHPLDRKAYEEWISEQGDDAAKGKEIIASLASLPTGDAWVWSPQEGFLKRIHFPLVSTFDSGKPLSRGQAAPTLAAIDTIALGEKMDALRQEAQANDPARLKARIRELEQQKLLPAATKADLDAAYGLGRMEGEKAMADKLGKMALDFAADIALATVPEIIPQPKSPTQAPAGTPVIPVASATQRTSHKSRQETSSTPKGSMSDNPFLLAAQRLWPVKLSWAQLGAIAQRKTRGGSFNTAKKRLLEEGYLREEGGLVVLVEPPEDIDTAKPADILEGVLPGVAGEMFAAIRRRPGMTVEELGTHLGRVTRGGSWNSGMALLKQNDLLASGVSGLVINPALEP